MRGILGTHSKAALVLLVLVPFICLPLAYADPGWVLLVDDTSQEPYFRVYYYVDEGVTLWIDADEASEINLLYRYNGKDIAVSVDVDNPVVPLKGDELPNKIWVEVKDGKEVNYYPDSRAGWWFAIKPERHPQFGGDTGDAPTFSTPELPLGTIMAIISTFAALTLFIKKPTTKTHP